MNVGGIASNAMVVAAGGEAQPRWKMDENGKCYWGAGGASVVDVTMERSAANVVSMGSGDSLRHPGAAHASLPSAAGFAAGSQFYCTTDKQPIWSDGAGWYEADGTGH